MPKANSSLASRTKALMTAMPEKLSWEKSDKSEKACCRNSHFFIRYFRVKRLNKSKINRGIIQSAVSVLLILAIFTRVSAPRNSASQNMRKPEPKQS